MRDRTRQDDGYETFASRLVEPLWADSHSWKWQRSVTPDTGACDSRHDLTQSREALVNYEAAYTVARLRYEGGLADYQSVLLAEDAVLAARRNVVDLKARAFTLDIQLIKALGGGFAST